MSTQEHLDAIREAMENHWTGDDEGHVVVMAHAEAMAKELAEAEAQELAWRWYAESVEGDFAACCEMDSEDYADFASDLRHDWRAAQDPDIGKWLPMVGEGDRVTPVEDENA